MAQQPLFGRLGLESARVPHVDRFGLLYLARGHLLVEDGTLHFLTAGTETMAAGDYGIPFQGISLILLGPGSMVSHDVFRLLARHGTGLVAVGEDGVRIYSAPPWGAGDSAWARQQVRLWAGGEKSRIAVARKMYAWRLGEILPASRDIAILRGMEGARMKETYRLLAQQFGIAWRGRHYDRDNPTAADPANQAINHAATAVEAAATVAVAALGAIPSLGFIHEDSSNAFCLDVADLFRDRVTLPVAFQGVREYDKNPSLPLESHVRKLAGRTFRAQKLIPAMIERIQALLKEEE